MTSPAIDIAPRGPLDCAVEAPGSKSISNRALLIAALAQGTSTLSGVLDSDDIRVMARALRAVGARLEVDGERIVVQGVAGKPQVPEGVIDVAASGTAARMLTALLALVPGETRLDGIERMRERPIEDLTRALGALGVDVRIEGKNGCPPLSCRGGKPFGGDVEIDATRSSQYVSAVLLVAPYATREVTLKLKGGVLVSRPYVDVTLDTMRAFGAEASFSGDAALEVKAGQGYVARDYAVEPDASTAAYFFAAAAITGGRVRVPNITRASKQADIAFVSLLEHIGCAVHDFQDANGACGIEVRGPSGPLRAFDVDMNAMPDAVLAAAVTALFTDGPCRITNVANLRIKETDRLAALERELQKLGAQAHADASSLTIKPGALRGAAIETYDDHRMAMSFALAGLRVPGVRILDPACVSKSWPRYFEAFERMR
jgi:3-phosphoshikimate 1-carboxyvinyltransferase